MHGECRVLLSGYQVYETEMIDPTHDNKRVYCSVISDSAPEVGGCHERPYNPFERTNLYREFSKLQTSPAAIEQFANEYGLLGLRRPWVMACAGKPIPIAVELLDDWYTEIHMMKAAVELMRLLRQAESKRKGKARAEPVDALKRLIRWSDDCTTVEYASIDYGIRGDSIPKLSRYREHDKQLFETFKPYDVVQPARVMLHRLVNQKLEEHAAPRLLCDDSEYKTVGYDQTAKSLLGAMWLQLAQDLVEKSSLNTEMCRRCKKPYPKQRSQGEYCSDRCRQAAHRARKESGEPASAALDAHTPQCQTSSGDCS